MPLRKAVFTFGVAADDMASDLDDKPFDALTNAEIAEVSARHFSIGRLTQMLAEKSGVTWAEIDLGT